MIATVAVVIFGFLPFLEVQTYSNPTEQTIYGDVISHCKNPDNAYDRTTRVHETVHFINNQIHNHGFEKHGFYCLKGRGIIFNEPNFRKNDIIPFIPDSCRGTDMYQLYILGAKKWNAQPLYIYDEWLAYSIGGMSCVEDNMNGVAKEWRDGVYGSLQFSVYAVALCMACEKHDPDYWNNNKDFKAFTHWWLIGSQNTFNAGKDMPLLKWERQNQLLHNLRTSEDAREMRQFINKHFGGVWLQ